MDTRSIEHRDGSTYLSTYWRMERLASLVPTVYQSQAGARNASPGVAYGLHVAMMLTSPLR